VEATDPAQANSARKRRRPRQGRSEDAVAKIARAVVSLLASEGQSGLTHRRVAEVAGVSLAATTYYYPNKFEMISDAQARLLEEYVQAFVRAKVRRRAGEPVVADLPDLVLKLVRNAAGRHGRDTLAWSEIMLDCALDERGHQLARAWFASMETVWAELIEEFGIEDAGSVVKPAIDTVVGLLFVTVALQLSAETAVGLLEGARPFPAVAAALSAPPAEASTEVGRPADRSRDTRERLVAAAVATLEQGDPSGLSFTAIAQRAGLTSAAPAYHFPTVEALLARAEGEVLRRMVERNAALMPPPPGDERGPSAGSDLLATIHIRSVLEDGLANVAGYRVWLSAARKPELRAQVADSIVAAQAAFAAYLDTAEHQPSSRFALAAMAQFVGRCVRVMATGRRTTDLASARREFEATLAAIRQGAHPALPRAPAEDRSARLLKA
jgi:AcrR family transcriptional regulator